MTLRKHMGDINKLYLSNTIQSVESHNRREQEVDCWRQHNLYAKIRADDLSDSRNDDNGVISRRVRCFTETVLDVDSEERARWAAKKACHMTLIDGSQSSSMHVPTATDHKMETKDSSEMKRSKKEKKAKRDKQDVAKEKKKEKKEKRASRKVTRDGAMITKHVRGSDREVINSCPTSGDHFLSGSRVLKVDR